MVGHRSKSPPTVGRDRQLAAIDSWLQIIRDWVLRFNAEGPDGLIDRKPAGPLPKLSDAQRRAPCEIVEGGPIPAVHAVLILDQASWHTTKRPAVRSAQNHHPTAEVAGTEPG